MTDPRALVRQNERALCEGSYSRPVEITKLDSEGQRIRGLCPVCGKDLAINRATEGVRAHHA